MKGTCIIHWILLVRNSRATSQTKHFYLSMALEMFLFILKKRLSKQKQFSSAFHMFKAKLNLNILFLYSHSYHIQETVNLNMQGTNSFDRTNYVCKNKTADYHVAPSSMGTKCNTTIGLFDTEPWWVLKQWHICARPTGDRGSQVSVFKSWHLTASSNNLQKMNKSKICVSVILHRREE